MRVEDHPEPPFTGCKKKQDPRNGDWYWCGIHESGFTVWQVTFGVPQDTAYLHLIEVPRDNRQDDCTCAFTRCPCQERLT